MRWHERQKLAEREQVASLHRVAATIQFGEPEDDNTVHFVTCASSLAELIHEVREQYAVVKGAITVHLPKKKRGALNAKSFASAIAGRTGWGKVTELDVRVSLTARALRGA